MSPPPDTSDLPRPRLMRRVWVPGIQYDGESFAQMCAREKSCREEDARLAAEEHRLWRWKTTPVWSLA